ncbi:LysR family transcriptional regulator [Pseudonocardia sp. TRM90224]|uniref:LysR family transcriptional regulator n=1 Tax=Pseudonocardia sp. TRM90224 TaxID=2812678 RepID=UPI001E4F4770|nr:LysR family transcriptional regulator [Pseudonocardia sp. TRM90224]
MDVEGLRTFEAIHRTGSVTAAAAALHLSQPAVSRRLGLLERELGAPLFERVPAGAVVSEAGRALLPYAERVLATVRDAHAAVQDVGAPDRGSVSLALVGTLAGTGLTQVLRRFTRLRPHVDVRLRTATSREVSELVRSADVTLGLRYTADNAPDLRSEVLFTERMVVVAAPDHPAAAGHHDGLAALAGHRWLAFPAPPGRAERSAGWLADTLEVAGVTAEQVILIDSLTAQKRLVEAGFGLAIMQTSGIGEEVAAGSLVVVDVAGLDLGIPVAAVTRRGGYLPAAAAVLLAELRTVDDAVMADRPVRSPQP